MQQSLCLVGVSSCMHIFVAPGTRNDVQQTLSSYSDSCIEHASVGTADDGLICSTTEGVCRQHQDIAEMQPSLHGRLCLLLCSDKLRLHLS